MHRPAALAFLLLPLLAVSAQAVEPRQGTGFLDRLALSEPRLRASGVEEPIGSSTAVTSGVYAGWTSFLQAEGGDWQGYVDRRNGLLEVAEGAGIPWIPGPGNHLTREDVAVHLQGAAEVDLKTLENIARAFLPRVSPLLGVKGEDLALSPKRSGQAGDQVWLVDFDVRRGGRTIEGARVVFRVSHGNLIQLGSENLPAPGEPAPRERIGRDEALSTLTAHVRGFSAADTFLDGGSLHLLPVALGDPRFAEGFEAGRGRGLGLVWEFVFQRRHEAGTWRARVDAVSGELLELIDVNRYAQAHGGVYPVSWNIGFETVLPMPYADLSSSGFTNGSGFYNYPGTLVTSALDGQYVSVYDSCGSISKTSSGGGRLAFGTSAGTDCATPGSGGLGNTHASRTQFYHLNRIKEVGRGWLPANGWLQSQLPTTVNIFDSCNAFWNGYSVNFFRSSSGCGNTGEIAAISLHEYGHGLDNNDGTGLSDFATGEAYADVTAALMLRDSCIGPGFFKNVNCDGEGDACTSCSGVRDIDWARHASNTPHTVANYTQLRCSVDGFYGGPCGAQGHCESQVISEALWDLAARDLPGAGTNRAWAIAERLWYLSRPTATSAYTCNTTTPSWTSDGCGTGSYWRTMRALDDDDGNLANGTPHSCQLFAAFNRHGMACPTDPGANVCFSSCTPPAAPALSAVAGQQQVQLSWTGGAGLVYDLYESETGCGSGWRRVANDMTATSITDVVVFSGHPHSYQVIAHPAGAEACASPPSACQTAIPASPPCTPPAPPAGVTAQAQGIDRIRVSWNAAATATDYEVWRAAAAAGPFTRIATVPAPETSWTDTNLTMGATFFYRVHSLSEDCVSAASATASATTPSCRTTTLYSNDFETGTGLSDWTFAPGDVSPDWRGIQNCAAHSGSKVFRFGGAGCTDEYTDYQHSSVRPAGSVGIAIPQGSARNRLSFWHRWDFELSYDGGFLRLSMDGGAATYVDGSALVEGASYNNGGWFSGTQSSFVQTVVDLDAVCRQISGDGCSGHTLRIDFAASTDSIIVADGWYLDDVTVTSCTLRGCTGAPQIGAATPAGDNQIQLTWNNGAPPSSRFNVYRALGTCAAAGPFEKVASGVTGSPWLDAQVSGQVAWAYRVTGLDASGLCESDESACVQATTTGQCTVPPVFAGLGSATNTAAATCGIDLTWPAATSRCGNAVTYDVYRLGFSGFEPGPTTWIASGLTGTSWRDESALVDSAEYFYVVRAVDAGNGRSDTNEVERGAEVTGEITPFDLVETFEGTQSGGGFDHPGWERRILSGPNNWSWSTVRVHSPTHSWLAPSAESSADREMVSPAFRATEETALSFHHTYELDGCSDGGTLEITTDGGATWSVLPDEAFTAGGFDATIGSFSNPLYGKRAWCGGTAGSMTPVTADLSAWAGEDVRLRWHAGEDSSIRYIGWYVDDVTISDAVQVQACTTLEPPPSAGLDFHTLPPCRLIDTRLPDGPQGGPALQPSALRGFPARGVCGIPPTARALAVNVTVFQPAAAGHLTLFPTGSGIPTTSTINFQTGLTRANNALLILGAGSGGLGVKSGTPGVVHLVVDVAGYFE